MNCKGSGVRGDTGFRGSGERGGQGTQGGQGREGSMFLGMIWLLEVYGLNKPKIAYTCNLNYHGLSWTEKFSVVGGWVVSK